MSNKSRGTLGAFGNPLGKGSNCKRQTMLCSRKLRRNSRPIKFDIKGYFNLINLDNMRLKKERLCNG